MGIKLDLTPIENIVIVKCLLAQACVSVCDCDTPCSCLKIDSVEIDVNGIQIYANDTVIVLRAENYTHEKAAAEWQPNWPGWKEGMPLRARKT